uniref:NACHT domain-containing protein n=1 Tax=Timema tahoe TaxID=61484 RepID=A0A7R9FGL0_9NEOP|nr:unnamed protein product [Timema tahoe]
MALCVSQWRISIGLFHQGSSRGPTTPSGEDQGRVDAVTQDKLLRIGGVETNPGPHDRQLVFDDPPETSSSVYQNSLQSEKVLLLREIEELKSQISAMESQGDDSGAEDVGYRLEDKKKQLKKIEKKERKENNPDLLKFHKEPLDTMEQANIDISPSLQFQKAPPSTLEQEVVLLQGQLQELRSQEMFLESLEDESDVEERLEDLEFKIESTQLELVGLERKIRQEQEGKQSQERRSTSRDTDLKLSAPEGVGDAAVKVFYRREGVANIHGPMYEVKLSLLIFLRNLNRGAIFDLCTNLHEAGAVDDVVYKSVTNQVGGDEVEDIVFLQLKHRDVDKDKPMYLLKSDDSFGVMKYFLSYCEIERQMSEETDHPIFSGKLENCVFVMFTNGMLEADFLGKQSKEAELDERIKEEIRIALRTTQNEGDVENIFNKLLKRITKWSEKQGIVSYLDNSSNFWPRFVRKVQMKRLNALSVYLKNLTIKFKEDKIKTLSERTLNNPGALCVVSEKGSLIISYLKIYMVLSESDTKDCVFVDSKWLMVNLDYIWSVWAGVWCTTLIILCNDHIPAKDVLEEIKRVLRSNSAARIVFVCSKDDTLPKTFGKNCVFLDEVYFSQLTVGSQDSVLGKKVTFQGHDVSIKSVIGTNSPDKYLKGAVLQDLICDSYFKIGEDLLNDDSYYIPRSLIQTNYLKKSILKWFKTNEVFAISNITEKQLQKFVSPNVVLFKFEGKHLVNIQLKIKVNNKANFGEQDELASNKISDNLHRVQKDAPNVGKIVILDHGKEREQFQHLYTQFSKDHKVHWLHLDRDSLNWKKSSNDISTIKKYINNESSETQVEIVNSLEDNLVLVIAEPGMGKTSLLKHVAAETKLSDPSKLVLYINLNDNDKTDFLDEIEQSDIDASTTKEFIFGSSKDKEDNSKGQLLEYFFGDFHNTIILMDSFDEISPDYSDKVCALIYEIRKSGVETLWVTSRPSMNNYLEDELSVLSYKMKPFSKDDQRKFLKTYWTLLVPSIEQDRLEVFIEELLADYGHLNIVKCLVDKGADINQPNRDGFNPLQVATRSGHLEVVHFLVGLKQNFKESLGEHIILLIASENGHINIVNYLLDLIDVNTVDSEGCTALHAAVRGGQLEVAQLLVKRNAHINCKDVHGYTALKYCVRNGRLDVLEFLVKNNGDINLSDENQVNLLHHAARAGQLENVKYLLKFGIDINSRDRVGFTALHHAIRNSNLHIVTYLTEAKADVNLPDNSGQSPLSEAAKYGKLDIVKYLFHNGAKVSMTDNVGCDVFLHATRNGRLNVVKYLFKMNANTCAVDKHGLGGLHFASINGSPEVVKYLVVKAFDVKASDKNGIQALHYAAQYGRLIIVKCLLEAGADINALDNDGRNVLIHASLRVQSRTVRFFILEGVDVNVRDNQGFDSLYHVVKNGQLNLVRFLVGKGAVIDKVYREGNTIVHIATENNHLDVLEYLVDIKKVDIHATNIRAETALNIAINKSYLNISQFLAGKGGQPTTLPICSNAERSIKSEHIPSIQDNTKPIIGHVLPQLCQSVRNKRLDTFKDLLKDGGDINATDKTGRNVLHHVIKCGGLEFVRHIVDMGGNIKVQALNGFNALHYALRKGEIDVVRYLIQKGADVNAIDKNNYSLIHIAVRNERLDILQCLVKAGGNVNIVDKCGCCALHYAVQHGNISLVKCLVENHANIELPDPRGFRCIHFSSLGKNLEVVKYLIGQKADLGAKDIEGNTALHISAQQGCLEVVRCLVESEATIETQNNRGQTALNLAKDNGHKDVVGYLEWRKDEMKGGRLILKYCSTEGDHVSVVSDDVYGGVIHSVEETLPSEGHDLSENNCVVQDGLPPLHRAARSGKIEAVKLAIREDADINLRDNKGFTALHHAVYSQEVDVLNVLLKMKAGCNIEDHKKRLPLHYAISKKSFAVVQCLVEGGSIVNAPDDEGVTALHLTARNGRFDYIKYLLQNGADVNLTDNKGLTALHRSTRNGTITNMMLLVSKDANFNAQDKSGLSALHHASISGRPKAVEYLVEMGVDLDILDRAGMTTFHHAVKHGRMEIVEFLAEKTGGRVDIHAVDGNGFSALHHAAKYGHLYLFQYLVNKDLDINLTDNKGFKAMHYAEINGHTKIVDFFSRIQVSDP